MEEAVIKKIMPHSIEAEQSVIGAMIMDRDAILTASEILAPDDFYERRFGLVFEAMTALFEEGQPVDLVTLQNRLRRMDAPEEVSSMEFVRALLEQVPTSVNVKYYAKIVSEKATLRRLIRLNDEISGLCYAGTEPLEDILETTEKKVFDIVQRRGTSDFVPIRQIVLDAIRKIEAASRTKGNVTGIATGFKDLDYQTSGLQPSDLVLIAARPSMGKTAFALNIAQYMSMRGGETVAVFSLEMSKGQLANRLLSMESGIDAQKLRNGSLSDADWDRLVEGAEGVASSNLIIDDTPGITLSELRSKCRKYKLENHLGVVIIDYLQLMSGGGRNFESRQQEISDISRGLKSLARELEVPVIALSQLSRAVEQRPDHRPMLSDLRESGAIEQDADVVMFLYRDAYYNKDTEVGNLTELIVAKQRNGPVGTVNLLWIPEHTTFKNFRQGPPAGRQG